MRANQPADEQETASGARRRSASLLVTITRPFGSRPAARQPRVARGPRRSLAWLLALGIIVVAISGVGAAIVYAQAIAPGQVAVQFCQALQARHYTNADASLSNALRAQLSVPQLASIAADLDRVEGPIIACGAAPGAGFGFDSGPSAVSLVLTRAKLGNLAGSLHLTREQGVWRIAALDPSVLGASLGALQTESAYCAAMRTHDYARAYAQLGSALQALRTADTFAQDARSHEQIDGPITACALAAVGQGNDTTLARLTISVTFRQLGTRTGLMGLGTQGSAWRITSLDPTLQGSDLGPLTIGTRFCAALTDAAYPTAYSLLTPALRQQTSLAAFTASLTHPTARWAGCAPDLASYHVTAASATYVTDLTLVDLTSGATSAQRLMLSFALSDSSAWAIAGIAPA